MTAAARYINGSCRWRTSHPSPAMSIRSQPAPRPCNETLMPLGVKATDTLVKRENEALQTIIQNLTERLEGKQNECVTLQRQLEKCQDKLAKYRAEYATCKAARETCERELAECRAQLEKCGTG